jgi:pyruvate formate lyase activating enzyme
MSGNIDYEFRTTVVRELHNQNDLISIGRWLNGAKKYSLQKFEDSGDLLQTGFSAYENHEMEGFYRDISDFFKETFKKGF